MEHRLFLNVHGVTVNIRSKNVDFIEACKEYFNIFVTSEEGECDLSFQIKFEHGFSLSRMHARQYLSGVKLGEDYGISDGRKLQFVYKECFVELEQKEKRWDTVVYFKKNLVHDIANRLFFKGSQTNKHYYRVILRLVIQNQLFMFLSQKRHCLILSAASVSWNNEAYVFAGLPGAGKTTIVKSIESRLDAVSVLAENYVLLIDGKVYPFPEGKSSPLVSPIPLKKVFAVFRDEIFTILPTDTREGVGMLRAINQITGELPEQSPFLCLAFLRGCVHVEEEGHLLSSFVEKFPIDVVGVDKDARGFIQYLTDTYGKTSS